MTRARPLFALLAGALALAGCRRAHPPAATATATATAAPAREPAARRTPFYANSFAKVPSAAALTDEGRALFFAPELSASGQLSCAGCHQPEHAFGPPPTLPLGDGLRAVPSLRYLQAVPRFNEHYQDSDGDGSDQGPAGGYTWDGRAQTVHEQARLPLYSPLEMANGSAEALVARLRGSRLAAGLRATFGADVLDSAARGEKALLWALEVYQQSPREFAPYDSKYDAVLRGQATLSAREAHGLQLFDDPAKGNCARCHPSRMKEGALPAFTDFGFNAIGVPRNRALAANADPRFFDLGLCGPLRSDLGARADYCGLFRAPSLRNVATRTRFFHNGVVGNLRDAVRFYVERDRQPERWYGRDRAYDDLPPRYRAQLDRQPPFGARPAPALSDAEIDDVVAFLGTLTDGYRPPVADGR